MDKLMRYCLLEEDYKEFKNEYSKLEARHDMTEASLIDWKTEEGTKAPLKTNPFLAIFLNKKSLELKNKRQVQTDSQVACEVPAHPRFRDGDIKPEKSNGAIGGVIEVTSQGAEENQRITHRKNAP